MQHNSIKKEEGLLEKTILVHEKNIAFIVSYIPMMIPDCIGIILYGSYGRGEGGWYLNENMEVVPYNDYDLLVIVKNTAPKVDLTKIKETIANTIGTRWVDISCLTSSQLNNMKLSIKKYDIKYASKVILGSEHLIGAIPEAETTSLRTVEIQVLFFTRLYALIGSVNESGLRQVLKGEDARFFRNQMAKAILAVVDVVLILRRSYHWSYKKRIELITEMHSENREYCDLCRWALNEKLHPESPDMSVEEVTLLYQKVNALYFTEMFKGLSVHFKMKINSPEMIELCMKWLPTQLVRRLYRIIRFRNLSGERELNILLAQMYIAAAWSKEGIDRKRLDRGCRLMKFESWEKNSEDMVVWNSARLYVAKIRMEL